MSAKKTKKLPVTGGLKVNSYEVLSMAIENGVRFGWDRAHKHTENPTEEQVLENMEREVMNSICEYFDFDGLQQ